MIPDDEPIAMGGQAPEPPPPSMQEGSIADVPIAKVLARLAERKATGLLSVYGENVIYLASFRGGKMARILEDPAQPNTLFGVLLHKTGVEEDKIAAALKQVETTGRLVGELLFLGKAATKQQVGRALVLQLKMRVGALDAMTEGRFVFSSEDPTGLPLKAPGLDPVQVVFRSKVDVYGKRDRKVSTNIELPVLEQYVSPSGDASAQLDHLKLNPSEAILWQTARERRHKLREIFAMSALNRRQTHAVVFALADLGYLTFHPSLDPARQREIACETIVGKAEVIRSGSLFEAIEIHWMAHTEDVIEGVAAMRKMYTMKHIDDPSPEIQAHFDKITDAIAEAEKTLTDSTSRRRYRATVVELDQIRKSADLLVAQGEMEVFKGWWASAVYRFIHAVELQPDNPIFKDKLRNSQTQLKRS